VLDLIQRQLEAIYKTRAPDVQAFLLDEEAVDAVLGGEARPADEWVLVRQEGEEVDVGVYVASRHLQALATADSLAGAVDCCFQAFCAAVEGVSHFLMLVERARRDEPVSLLELETQAEVDKYLCASLHHPTREPQLRSRLFREAALAPGLSPDETERYAEAARLAEAWCEHLDRLPHVQAVLDRQRAFWRRSGSLRLEEMRRLAA